MELYSKSFIIDKEDVSEMTKKETPKLEMKDEPIYNIDINEINTNTDKIAKRNSTDRNLSQNLCDKKVEKNIEEVKDSASSV